MPNDVSASEFGASFKGFMEQMAHAAPAAESFFRQTLRQHLAIEPEAFVSVSQRFPLTEQPNLQRALDAWLAAPGRSHRLVGVTGSEHHLYTGLNLGSLVALPASGLFSGSVPTQGPVSYESRDVGEAEPLSCVKTGISFVTDARGPLVVLVSSINRGFSSEVVLELAAASKALGEGALAELRRLMQAHNVYRGKVVSVEEDGQDIRLRFRTMPDVERSAIVLPDELLQRIERHTLHFSRHAAVLRATGRHLKRGLLLHGPPGTGKTLTAMYLAKRMEGRTVFVVAGQGAGLLERACTLARVLAPATLVLEDVDLIGSDRDLGQNACRPLLFELLNQMDGMAEDTDVLFILTTNRPEVLEPALAARPGRVDQALEVPLPDAECRRRLFELYGKGLSLEAPLEPLVTRTEGASPSFIRELLRRAALFAADDGVALPLVVGIRHVELALKELLLTSPLTRQLLGFQAEEAVP